MKQKDPKFIGAQPDPIRRADQIIYRMDRVIDLVQEHVRLTKVIITIGIVLIVVETISLIGIMAVKM